MCGVNIFRPFSPWVLLINVYLKHCAYQIKIFTLTFRLQSISYIFLGIARSIYEKNMLSHSTFKYHILHLMIMISIIKVSNDTFGFPHHSVCDRSIINHCYAI